MLLLYVLKRTNWNCMYVVLWNGNQWTTTWTEQVCNISAVKILVSLGAVLWFDTSCAKSSTRPYVFFTSLIYFGRSSNAAFNAVLISKDSIHGEYLSNGLQIQTMSLYSLLFHWRPCQCLEVLLLESMFQGWCDPRSCFDSKLWSSRFRSHIVNASR